MKKLMILAAVLAACAGCGSGQPSDEKVETDLENALFKAGVKYNNVQVTNGLGVVDLRYTGISDLAPLKGMPICALGLGGNPVSDLAPLKDLPITNLDLAETKVTDLSPISGMKLEILNLHDTQVTDLTPLKAMPLTSLTLWKCKKVTDLSPLAESKLTVININSSGVTDLTPLANVPLEKILISRGHNKASMDTLRNIPTLKQIALELFTFIDVSDFWQRYDEGKYR